MMNVTILGNNSAVPAFDRHPTAQVVTTADDCFLVDCGEGTQVQLIRYKVRRSRISHIFISHLHGDHFFGLAGLVTSFGLLGRQQPLHIFAPGNLEAIIKMQLDAGQTTLPYPLLFTRVTDAGVLLETEKIKVSSFKTTHRIECYGYRFAEKRKPRKLDAEKARQHEIPTAFYERLRNGEDYTTKDGRVIANHLVTDAAPKGKVYAYCADTCYDEGLLPHITGADMIYHETTYLDNFRDRAFERGHSTSKQAAELALKAGVEKLLIGHFSSKYEKLDEFLTEAQSVFPNTQLAEEGVSFLV
jgi:ribonuclease Z